MYQIIYTKIILDDVCWRLDKVLERNHRFLLPQIIWSVDLIRGVLF